MVILPDVQKSVRTNSAVTATSLSILSLLVPFSLLLLLHWEYMKGLLLADIFFRDYNEDSLWGWNHWLKKTVLRAQCWPQGETFEACKAQTDSPALHVLSNSEHLRQSMHALSYFFSKGDSILSLERPSSRWVVIFRALSKHDPLWMKLEVAEEHKVAEEQSRAKTPTLFESYGYIRFQWNSNLLPWAKDQSSLQLVHYPILEYCVLLVVLFVIVLSGIDVLSDYFL